MEECPIKTKIADRILNVGVDEETDEFLNPWEHTKIQNELGKHLVSCQEESCTKSTTARIEAGIMNSFGEYIEAGVRKT